MKLGPNVSLVLTLLSLPFSWQTHEENSQAIATKTEIIDQLIKQGFDLFKTIKEKINENENPQFDFERFISKDYPVISNLMNGTKLIWSFDEVLEILEYGDYYFVTGEALERILNITVKAIYSPMKEEEYLILKEQIEIFKYFQNFDFYSDQSKYELAIDLEGKRLKLNGWKIDSRQLYLVVEYFMKKTKYFNEFFISDVKITPVIAELIVGQLEGRLASFYATDVFVEISQETNLIIYSHMIENSEKFHFISDTLDNIDPLLESIPYKSLYDLEIYHPDVTDVVKETKFIEKMNANERDLIIRGMMNLKAFYEFYSDLLKKFTTNAKPTESSHTPSRVRLFSSQRDDSQYQKIINEYRSNHNSNYFKNPNSSELLLDLLETSAFSFLEDGRLAKQFEYDFLNVNLDSASDIDYVSEPLTNNEIIEVALNFYSYLSDTVPLSNVLKYESLKSFIFFKYFPADSDNFICSLMSPSICENLEFIRCYQFSIETVLQLLKFKLPRLKKLHLTLPKNDSTEEIDEKQIDTVRDLFISFSHQSDDQFNKILACLLEKFPNIKRLTIKTHNELEIFLFNDKTLERLEINCKSFKRELEIIRRFINNNQLKLLDLKQKDGNNIKMIKEENSICYDLKVEKQIQNPIRPIVLPIKRTFPNANDKVESNSNSMVLQLVIGCIIGIMLLFLFSRFQ